MADFYRDFLHQEITERPRNAPPVAHLAAFGKHPAWNDHMEDIGLTTLALLEAKRYLYLQGISGQIDTGAWDKTAMTFNHWLLWHRPGEILLGRLLASSDGKGRTRYPLVVLAHIINLPLAAALEVCAPLIDQAAQAVRQATTPDAAGQAVAQARARIAIAAENAPDNPSAIAPGIRPDIAPGDWARVYHAIESQLYQFGPGARAEQPACRHLRLPAASARPVPNLLWWSAYWLTQLDPRFPSLFIAPETVPHWLDFIVGEPASQHLRCILCDLDSNPPVTDVPYDPAPHITQVTNELLQGSDFTSLPERSLFRLQPPTRDSALATIGTRAGLARVTRPPGLLRRLFD